MRLATRVLIALVAVQHLGFFVLESFLWTSDVGRQTFHSSVEFAESSRVLAANQGVYNAFLAAALLLGVVLKDARVGRALAMYGLGCVVVAGIVGGATADPQIVLVQALPAGIALALLLREPRPRAGAQPG